jgi:xylulokinase
MPRHARVEPSAEATTVTVADDDVVAGTATVAHDPHDPVSWAVSFERALGEATGGGAAPVALSVGPASGVVVLDADRHAVWVGHPRDVDAAPDAGWLTKQLPDGADGWIAAIGRVPSGDDAISLLSWLHRSEPAAWSRLAHVVSPSGWLLAHLTGRLVTSADDAAATGWWSACDGRYRLDLLAIVDRDRDWSGALPAVVESGAEVGTWQDVAVAVG